MFEAIRCIEQEEGIWRVEIGNPPLNLLTQTVRKELGDAFAWLDGNERVRVVVFGSPGNFCAGADLKEFPLRFDASVARAHGENGQRMVFNLAAMRKPVIAAIDGNCMGGGYELALACGFRIASSRVRLALPEIKRGVWPGTGGVHLLERLVGPSTARRMLMTGETFDAQAALQRGLVDEVVGEEALDEHVMQFARELANRPPSCMRSISMLLDHDFLDGFRRYLAYELELFVQAYQHPAAREGNQAFFEKRAPRW